MEYSAAEKKFRALLSFYAFIFFVGTLVSGYYFYCGCSEHPQRLLLLLTPPLLLFFFILSKIAAGGIRKNYSYSDLLMMGFIAVALCTGWHFVASLKHGATDILSGIYAATSLLLFILTLILWRKAVIAQFGLNALSPTQALSYRALAEVLIGDYRPEGYSFDTIVKDFDDYLNRFESPTKSSVKLVYVLMQYLPVILLNIPLTWMGVEERRIFIKKTFERSGSGWLRFLTRGVLLTLFRSAKQLVYFIYYGNKPAFPTIGYTMFEDRKRYKEMPPIEQPKRLEVSYISSSREIETDYCVIGSGAAGAVTAYNLAKKTGKKVTILEKGRYYFPQEDFTNMESQMIGSLYRDGGLELTQDYDLAILQGICVGGSTTVNNGICFRTPQPILENWEKLGAKIDQSKLEKSFDVVEQIIKAKQLDLTKTNEGANRFFKGAEKAGLNPQWFVTNFGECGGSGYCNLGCRYNRKLSMLLNYLPMAVQLGAEIIADASVEKIITNGNRAEKIVCKTSDGVSFTVKAKHIVVAAGAIASSGILLKSGIKRNVGTRLSFNMTTPMMAEFPEVINSYDGIQMCCYVKNEKDGYIVETVFNPPGASALTMQGWFEVLNERMKHYDHYAMAAPVVGTEPNGKIKLSLFGGNTVVDYALTPGDFAKLKLGMKALSRIFLTAGADCVLPASYDDLIIRSDADLSKIDTQITAPHLISLSSAHPQGGNPLSDNKELGAVDTNFRVHGYSNLYVCDASVFPTGVGVNPQLSIMGLADYAADTIAGL